MVISFEERMKQALNSCLIKFNAGKYGKLFIKNDSVLYEEGRNATSLPTLNIKNIKDWTGDIENYLLDNIGYRNKILVISECYKRCK